MKLDEKRKQFIRFLIVGTLATIIQYSVYYILIKFMHTNIAYTIGFILSFCANFLMTTLYTFKSKITIKNFLGFGGQQIFNYTFQLLFLNIFLWLKVPKEIAPIPVFVIILPLNFMILRFVFKKKIKDQIENKD